MIEALQLTTQFIVQQPEAAARVMEETPSTEVALLLSELSARQVAPMIAMMFPGAAARRLSAMSTAKAAAILIELDGRSGAAILRICSNETRRALLELLPARRVRHFNRALAYTQDTVGAWIDYDVPALAADNTAGDALQLLHRRAEAKDVQVFALSSSRGYAGIVPVTALLQSPAETPLSRLADRSIRALTDSMNVDGLITLDDWDQCNLLPVIGPDGSLLGGLSRAGLRRALNTVFPNLPAAEPDSLLAHLFTAYLRAGSELVRLLLGSNPPARPVEDSDGH